MLDCLEKEAGRVYGWVNNACGAAPLLLGGLDRAKVAGALTSGLADVILATSREALGKLVLPAVLVHRFARRHACAGKLWRSLLAERDAGRIGALGVSATNPEEAWAALEDLREPLRRIHATAEKLGFPPPVLFLAFAREYSRAPTP